MSVDETPQEAAPEKPTVVDVEIQGDRVLAGCDRGDVSVAIEAPVGISAAELEAALEGVPGSIERTSKQFTEATMSDNTTEVDRSTEVEETADDDVGGGA